MTEPTTATLKTALKKISVMDFGPDVDVVTLESSDALALIVDLALDALNPKAKPSAFEIKTKEVADFVMTDFKLAFASNDEIAEALNTAGIKSPQGKDWTRSNISKIMTAVRDDLVQKVQATSPAQSAGTVVAASTELESSDDAVSAAHSASEATQEPMTDLEKVPEPVAATSDDSDPEIDDILSELDELDDLQIPA